MQINKIYGIFSGSYSDKSIHGFMINEEDARKYCALKNNEEGECYYSGDDYYTYEINEINADVKDVKLKYYHKVIFDFGNNDNSMRVEPDRYDYYIGEDKESKLTYNIQNGWISFESTCETRKKAEKIAQDKFAEFLYNYAENNNYELSAMLIGGKRQE